MSERIDRIVLGLVVLFTLVGFAAFAFMEPRGDGLPGGMGPAVPPTSASATEARDWFDRMRPHCNGVEVESRIRMDPPPPTDDARAYEATCYGLAGKIEQARLMLLALPEDERWRGAGVLFEVVHPAADAGDELAAGPLMELVVEFWPNHHMALYHAGAAAHMRGEWDVAGEYMQRFLVHYDIEDGWTRRAREILAEIG